MAESSTTLQAELLSARFRIAFKRALIAKNPQDTGLVAVTTELAGGDAELGQAALNHLVGKFDSGERVARAVFRTFITGRLDVVGIRDGEFVFECTDTGREGLKR